MNQTVILLDTSSSMLLPVGARRRVDVLASAMGHVLSDAPGARLFSFNSVVCELQGAAAEHGVSLPECGGGTDLHLAIERIAPLRPALVVVISDGEPSDRRAAIAAARGLGCAIHAVFVGNEADRAAVAFMRDLGLCGRGAPSRPVIGDLRQPAKLTADLRLLLAGPNR